ncbi:alkaline phosphatase D family protein [Methylicorpusculum oleiharenae]|uniref:alkaline phosphatase D family protein n=1 Tax=Methylicorpusculum oleiharenae TaxID=1338687 RepID=UPI00135ACC12|nr:alkaline phosphatase D family protein [Methylicorpusculum oleiharenae]MCD2451569.1 alkaline phosphatase D family protein [Methylicorpusculum oleiharenae]
MHSTINYSRSLLAVVIASMTITASAADVPLMAQGIQIGDVDGGRAVIWSRADRPSRMMVEYALDENFTNAVTVRGPYAMAESDFTSRQDLTNLPEGKEIYVKVWFEDLTNARSQSEPVTGHFHTVGKRDNIRFVWGGDTAGQGWGINESFGGMKIYEAMRQVQPQFFIQSGDSVYSDGPIPESKIAENGLIWTNLVTPEVSKVAETLNEFRGRYKYNFLDENLRRFNAEVPQIWQWDDHEVVNNWSDSKDLSADPRYTVKDVPLLVARATQAFHEFAPLRPHDAEESERIYRKLSYGKLLDVFVIDMRSYRGPNTNNLQTQAGPETVFLGEQQLAWLKEELKNSKATWKVISSDMPIGLNIGDGSDAQGDARWEAIANGNDGAAAGRELEIAELLSFIKHKRIDNIVWLTADVHYAAAHFYDPRKATSKDFTPFWEFVAGPLNAGSFGPNSTDGTFGPQVVFNKAPAPGQVNLSPYAGLQFFGEVNIDRKTQAMTVDLKDIEGDVVFSQTLPASQHSNKGRDRD